MASAKGMLQAYTRRRFAWLFIALLGTMVATPVLTDLGFNTRLIEILLALCFLVSVVGTMVDLGAWPAIVLFAMVVIARQAHVIWGFSTLLVLSQILGIAICLMSIIILVRYTLVQKKVDSECIFAALNVYLLMGVMCGIAFFVLDELMPGSLAINASLAPGGNRTELAHTLYFSFVTLGTLGYGDITPVSSAARALAVAEAICGQMYLVVVVARLVATYSVGNSKRE